MREKFEIYNDTKIDESKYENIELTESERENMKNRMKASLGKRSNKGYKKQMAVASAGLIVVGSIVLTSETTWAYLESIGRKIEIFLGREGMELDGYKVAVNKEMVSEGIKLTLKEIMLDDGQLLLSLNLDDKDFDYKGKGIPQGSISVGTPKITMNDVVYSRSSGSTESVVNKDGTIDVLVRASLDMVDTDNDGIGDKKYEILENIDQNTDYNIKIEFDSLEYAIEVNAEITDSITSVGIITLAEEDTVIEEGNVSDELNIDESEDQYRLQMGKVEGQWVFEEVVNGSKIIDNTTVHKIDKEIQIKEGNLDGVIYIEEVRVSPVSVKTKYRYKTNINTLEHIGFSIGVDVFDEKGKDLRASATGSGDEYGVIYLDEADLKGNEEKIIIKPYVYLENGDEHKYLEDNKIEIDLDKK